MKKINKNKIKYFFGGLVIVALFVTVGIKTSFIKLPIVSRTVSMYAANFSKDEILVGYSKNIFIGKVLKREKTFVKKNGSGEPTTRFYVEVIDNIKGNLQGNVYVDQEGGYLNGILHIVNGDIVDMYTEGENKDKSNLMKVGYTYIMVTGDTNKNDKYWLFSHPRGKFLLSNDKKKSVKELKEIVKKNERVKELKEAYKNEEIPVNDIISNDLKNSYKKYTDEDRRKVVNDYYKKIKEEIRKNIILDYKTRGIMITSDEIDKIIELGYSSSEKIKLFNSPEESEKWYSKHPRGNSADYEKIKKIEKEIEERAKIQRKDNVEKIKK